MVRWWCAGMCGCGCGCGCLLGVLILSAEDAPHMKQLVLDETMEDMDKNRDGFISIQEYVGQ